MSAPHKDFPQVLKESYDYQQERIRVEGTITDGIDTLVVNPDGSINTNITGTDIDIRDLNASQDNVAISDGTDTLVVNPDGSINVVVSSTGVTGDELSFYNNVNAVVGGVLTTILTYTVPVATNSFMKRVEVSGTNIAEYTIEVDAVVAAKQRTYFGAGLNTTFEFGPGVKYTTGQVITVKVLHNRPDVGDFDARLQVNEV